jgi:hypothetical protein
LKRNIYADFSYLFVLAASFGGVLVLGALVAPVIFHTDRLPVTLLIDNYNAGIVMAEIFHRFSYWLYFVALFVVVYEVVQYKTAKRDSIIIASASLVVFASLMFSVVYAPRILAMQALGVEATQSDTFHNIHLAAEIDFKLLAICLAVLFVRRLMLMKID